MSRRFVRILANTVIAVAIVFGGVQVAKKLIASKEAPKHKESPNLGLLVETETAEIADHQLIVRGNGTVMASRTVDIHAQVPGEVVWVNDAVVLGGRVKEGDELFRLERRDYELALIERKTAVEQAQAQLALEQGHKEVAEQEWEIFEQSASDLLGPEVLSNRNLATREPQILSALKTIEAAKSRVSRAKLDLTRTNVRAPLNAVIQSEGVELGQLVSTQSVAVTLVGSDVYWVAVSVPIDRLDWIEVPGLGGSKGSSARVLLEVGEREASWSGEVIRLLPEVDPAGRMARLLVEVKNPLEGDFPLLIGSYVTVEIGSKQRMRAVEIARNFVHGGDKVYLYGEDGTLEIRKVEAGWRRDETLLVTKGLLGGEAVITSRIGSPIPDMKLRLAGDKPSAAAQEASTPPPKPKGESGSTALPEVSTSTKRPAPALDGVATPQEEAASSQDLAATSAAESGVPTADPSEPADSQPPEGSEVLQ